MGIQRGYSGMLVMVVVMVVVVVVVVMVAVVDTMRIQWGYSEGTVGYSEYIVRYCEGTVGIQ